MIHLSVPGRQPLTISERALDEAVRRAARRIASHAWREILETWAENWPRPKVAALVRAEYERLSLPAPKRKPKATPLHMSR